MSYALIRQAILDRTCVSANYQGSRRHFAPHCIGLGKDRAEHVMGFQYAGGSSKGLPPGGQWRCFRVADLSNVSCNSDSWQSSPDHARPNTCVVQVDVQVAR